MKTLEPFFLPFLQLFFCLQEKLEKCRRHRTVPWFFLSHSSIYLEAGLLFIKFFWLKTLRIFSTDFLKNSEKKLSLQENFKKRYRFHK